MKNKVTSMLLALTLLTVPFFGMQTAQAADADNLIYTDLTSITAGAEVDIPVYISGNSGFAGFGIILTYDADVLTPVDMSDAGGIIVGGTQNSIGGNLPGLAENAVKVMYSGASNVTEDGLLFTMTFSVNAEATGSTTLQVEYDQNDTLDEDINDVVLNCKNMVFSISNASLDNNPVIELAADNVTAGQSTTLTGILKNKSGLTGATITLNYDADNFEYISITSDALGSQISDNDGTVSFTLADLDTVADGGICFSVTLRAIDTANAGDYSFTASASAVTGAQTIYIKATTATVYSSETSDSAIIKGGSDISGKYGETLTVPVFISNNKGLMGYKLSFGFDKDVLEPTYVGNTYLFSGSSFYDNIGVHEDYFDVMWNYTENVTSNGQIFYLEFTVLTEEKVDTQIRVSYSQADTYNEAWEDVSMLCNDITVSLNPKAESTSIDDFEYTLDGNEMTITYYMGADANVIIGSTYVIDSVEYTVVAIEESAFETNTDVTSVYIPETVTRIGAYCFYDCTSLTEVTIMNPDAVIEELALGYYYVSRREDGIVEGFTIYGMPGSTAEEYAAAEEAITFASALPALKVSAASLKLQNNIAIKFYVKKAVIDGIYSNPRLVVAFGDTSINITTYTQDDTYYIFTFRNIAPHKMKQTATATLYAAYGEAEYNSEPIDYSIAQYCYTMLSKNADNEELRTLLVDILRYGAASQNYVGYETDDPADAALTEEQAEWGTTSDPSLSSCLDREYATVTYPEVEWKAANLNLNSTITMRLHFTADDLSGITVKIADGNGKELGELSEFKEEGGRYVAEFSGLHAGQMSEPVYFTAYRDDAAVSNTVCYSIESYAYAKQQSTVAGLADLVKAMMKYGNSAYAYAYGN